MLPEVRKGNDAYSFFAELLEDEGLIDRYFPKYDYTV
jgi:hypothetical protein